MNGLPEDVDLSVFLGQQVDQIRFSKWSVQLLFDGLTRIVIESHISLSGIDKSPRIEDYAANATEICQLIGVKVTHAERISEGGMALKMSSGMRIEIHNSNAHHESFQVHIGDEVLVA